MLKDKHSLEEQEEKLRQQKEQLQLKADIAASMPKVNVLRTSGSGEWSAASQRSDGMESYFKKKGKTVETLNIDAETFVPQKDEKGKPATENSNLHFGRPKQKRADNTIDLQQRPSELMRQRTVPNTTAPPVSHRRYVHAPLSTNNKNDQNHMLSVMEKQNEITSMLLHQQCLASLPRRDIQILDGDPLQYHSFMRSFEQVIEEKTDNVEDSLHFLEQYTRGQPQQLVRSCQYVTDGSGYAKAKTLLHEHFGNEYMI